MRDMYGGVSTVTGSSRGSENNNRPFHVYVLLVMEQVSLNNRSTGVDIYLTYVQQAGIRSKRSRRVCWSGAGKCFARGVL